MTSITAQPAPPAQQQSRRLILTGAIAVALISTAGAYYAMVGFAVDILAMSVGTSYAFAGVFELSLVTVALMAREAMQNDRPAPTLLACTWLLSAASGFFAAWHELAAGHGIGAAVFRIAVPLLAALMWHFALIGDKHLATGRTFSQLLAGRRMHTAFEAVEDYQAAHDRHTDPERGGTKKTLRQLDRANARMVKASRAARRTVAPADMHTEIAAYVAGFEAFAGGVFTVQQLQHDARPASSSTTDTAAPAAPVELAPIANPVPNVLALQAATEKPADEPAEPQTPVSPAAPVEAVHEAPTAPVEAVRTERPHLASVPNTKPAEEKAATAGQAPEPEPPTKRSTDTSSTAELALQAATLRADGHKVKEIARRLDVSERTVYRLIKQAS